MSGRLIAIGVGPGDPELMTLKAVRALATADVVAYFAKAGNGSNARQAHQGLTHLPGGRGRVCGPIQADGPAGVSGREGSGQRGSRLARKHQDRMGTSISAAPGNRRSSAALARARVTSRSCGLAVIVPL